MYFSKYSQALLKWYIVLLHFLDWQFVKTQLLGGGGEGRVASNTSNIICDTSEFYCAAGGYCIPIRYVCDGDEDCDDGSDEPRNCRQGCAEGQFTCTQFYECIRNEWLCDGDEDCDDGTDEHPANCRNTSNGLVSSIPHPSYPISGHNGQVCSGVSCDPVPICVSSSHTTSSNCTPIDPNWKLIYASGYTVDVLPSNVTTESDSYNPTPNLVEPLVGIAYDVKNNVIYYAREEKIFKRKIEHWGRGHGESVITSGLALPEGIAFDYIEGNLYIADSILSKIIVCGNATNFCSVLFQKPQVDIDTPKDIAVVPELGYLFWTQWGQAPGIRLANARIGTITEIVLLDTKQPTGIALDQANSRVYWADVAFGRVESCTFTGSDRTVVLAGVIEHPFNVAILGNRIFWSDLNSTYIKSAEITGGQNYRLHPVPNHTSSLSQVRGIAIMHISSQNEQSIPERRVTCSTTNCFPFCALNYLGQRCICPSGFELNSKDNTSCVESPDTPNILISINNTLKMMRLNSIGREVFEDVLVPPEIKSISAMLYNTITHKLILSDSLSQKIYEYDLITKRLGVLINDTLGNITTLAIDVVGQNLYWVNADQETIEVMSLRTRARITVLEDAKNVTELFVGNHFRSVFILEKKLGHGKLYKMGLNGEDKTEINDFNVNPGVVAHDVISDTVFWIDKETESIQSKWINENLTGGAPFDASWKIKGHLLHPHSMAVYSGQVFWVDVLGEHLKSVNLNTYSMYKWQNESERVYPQHYHLPETFSNHPGGGVRNLLIVPRGLVQASKYESWSHHECYAFADNFKKCSHVCVASRVGFHGECICPPGMSLDSDGITCTNGGGGDAETVLIVGVISIIILIAVLIGACVNRKRLVNTIIVKPKYNFQRLSSN